MIARGVAGLVLLSTLVACGGSDKNGAPASGTSSEPTTPSAAPSTTPPSTPANTPASASVPEAKDGQNYKACNDGTCEVLIRGNATLNLNGDKSTVTVVDGTLKITDDNGYVSISGGGMSSWGDSGGPLHTATLRYAEGDTAVLVLTTRK